MRWILKSGLEYTIKCPTCNHEDFTYIAPEDYFLCSMCKSKWLRYELERAAVLSDDWRDYLIALSELQLE